MMTTKFLNAHDLAWIDWTHSRSLRSRGRSNNQRRREARRLMPALLMLFIATLFFIFPQNSHAQIIGVAWKAESAGLELLLNRDGAYRFRGPTGESRGWYALAGDILQMQDALTGVTSVYRITLVKPGVIVLSDSFGGAVEMTAGDESAATVLANANGRQLTEADMEVGYDMIRLIIDAPLTEHEKTRLRQKAIEEFKGQPLEFLQQVSSLGQALAPLRNLRDPQQLGLARQKLFAELYFASKPLPEDQKPEIIRIINEHVRVVAEDPENKVLLTDRDIDAFLAFNDFIAALTGSPPLTSGASGADLRQMLQKQFNSLPLQTKQDIAAVYPVWQAINKVWPGLAQPQRRQIVSQYRTAMNNTSSDALNQAPILTDPRAMSQASPQQIYQRSMDSMKQSVMTGWMRQITFMNTMNVAAGGGTSFWPSAFD